MIEDNDKTLSPTREEEGVNTAPTLTAADEIRDLQAEVARLKARLADTETGEEPGEEPEPGEYPKEINYNAQPMSGARLSGITKERDRIEPSTNYPELPAPTKDQAQLEADFMRWGYCLIKDAMSSEQVDAQVERLVDQAEAEKAAGVAHESHRGTAQTVFNLIPKGQVFRDLVALEASAAQEGPLVEKLLEKILGPTFYMGTAHGSIVHQNGGRQEMHQDQGYVPLPHPPYPLYSLIIWLYSDFSLENGGTYVVPGSHREASGLCKVRPEVEFEKMAHERLLALTAPKGTCFISDSRILHSGGMRSAPGTRYASRILYARGMMRQQENQLASVPREIVDAASPKLKELLGFRTHSGLGMVDGNGIDPYRPKIHVAELSMSRPEEFGQDFDWKYTENAKQLSEKPWNTTADYKQR